jgi:hypothetical protein
MSSADLLVKNNLDKTSRCAILPLTLTRKASPTSSGGCRQFFILSGPGKLLDDMARRLQRRVLASRPSCLEDVPHWSEPPARAPGRDGRPSARRRGCRFSFAGPIGGPSHSQDGGWLSYLSLVGSQEPTPAAEEPLAGGISRIPKLWRNFHGFKLAGTDR